MKKINHCKNISLKSSLLMALVMSVLSCGGVAPTNHTLSNAPSGFSYTDNDGNAITQGSSQSTIKIQANANGLTLMSIKIDGPVDLSNLTAYIDQSIFLAHFNDAAAKQNITSLTAYVPCASEAVVVCPGVTETNDVVENCAGGIELTASAPTNSGYTLDGRFDGVCHVSADIATFGTGIMGSTSSTEDLNGPFKTCSFALPFPPPACGPTICGAGTFVPDETLAGGSIVTIGLDSCGNAQITCRVPCSESALCGKYMNQSAFEGLDPDESQCTAAVVTSANKPGFDCPEPNMITFADYKDPNDYNEPDAEYWCLIRNSDSDYDPPDINFFVTPDNHGPFPLATMDPLDSIDQAGTDANWGDEEECPYIHNHDFTVEGHIDTGLTPCGHGGLILLDANGNVL